MYFNKDLIYFILILFIIFNICKNDTISETFTSSVITDQYIEEAITKIYNFDVESIKNLFEIAKNLYKDDYFELPGNVKINGTFNYLPRGCIMPYYSDDTNIPEGWAICDGTNNTPNLRGRFIVGYSNTYAVGSTGGATHVTLSNGQLPYHIHYGGHNNHTHNYYQRSRNGVNDDDNRFNNNHHFSNPYFGMKNNCNANTYGDTNHIHSSNGGNQSHENRPPYYTLLYIMKL